MMHGPEHDFINDLHDEWPRIWTLSKMEFCHGSDCNSKPCGFYENFGIIACEAPL